MDEPRTRHKIKYSAPYPAGTRTVPVEGVRGGKTARSSPGKASRSSQPGPTMAQLAALTSIMACSNARSCATRTAILLVAALHTLTSPHTLTEFTAPIGAASVSRVVSTAACPSAQRGSRARTARATSRAEQARKLPMVPVCFLATSSRRGTVRRVGVPGTGAGTSCLPVGRP